MRLSFLARVFQSGARERNQSREEGESHACYSRSLDQAVIVQIVSDYLNPFCRVKFLRCDRQQYGRSRGQGLHSRVSFLGFTLVNTSQV